MGFGPLYGDLFRFFVRSDQLTFVDIDGARVLSNVAGIVNSTRKLLEITFLDRLQRSNTDLGGRRDGLERNSSLSAFRGRDYEKTGIVHPNIYWRNVNVEAKQPV